MFNDRAFVQLAAVGASDDYNISKGTGNQSAPSNYTTYAMPPELYIIRTELSLLQKSVLTLESQFSPAYHFMFGIQFGILKVLIICGINSVSIGNGFIAGHVAAMIRSLKKKDDIALEDSEIYFLASSVYFLGIIGLALAAIISDKIGRRWSFIVFSTPMTVNFIILYFAQNMTALVISRFLGGIALGGLFALKICTTSEYVSPDSRGLYLNLISTLAPSVGIAISHALGNIWHWRIIALVGVIPSGMGIILPFFWEESPHWLASKGKFEECANTFHKIHGNGEKSEIELQLMIKMEKTKLRNAQETKSLSTFKNILFIYKKIYFWELIFLSILMQTYLTAAGKISYTALAIVIIEEITGSTNVFLFTLVVDGFIITGSCLSCVLITKMSMRNMLFTTSIVAISVLILLSVTVYFKTTNSLLQWLSVILLSVYFLILKAGPYPVLEALLGEIYPLEMKLFYFFISSSILMGALSLNIFLLPYMVKAMGYHGLFFLNAIIMSLSLMYIWWRLPETKGRTLQEIELYFKTKTFCDIDKLNNEQIKTLI